MATILDTLKKGTEYLEKYGIEEARLNMEHLIAHVLKVDRMQLYLDFDRPLDEEALSSLRELTKERSRGKPLQHLLGTIEFSGFEFTIDNRALIPRPETEELVEKILAQGWDEETSELRILDMGCGSGVLGLTLFHKLADQEPEVVLSDISTEALSLAQENARRQGAPNDRITLLESDLFDQISGEFDFIAANLPYIPNRENTELSREVLQDPELALYGGEEGTEIILKFLSEAPHYLRNGGKIALEFGFGQAPELQAKAEEYGFDSVRIEKDLSGNERFLFATKSQ